MDSADRNELRRDECDRLIAANEVGRLATTSGSLPIVYPVRYALLEGHPVIRARRGSRLHRTTSGHVVCLELDDVGSAGHGWSVVVIGQAEVVDDRAGLESCARLALVPSEAGDDVFVLIRASLVAGRRLDSAMVRPA